MDTTKINAVVLMMMLSAVQTSRLIVSLRTTISVVTSLPRNTAMESVFLRIYPVAKTENSIANIKTTSVLLTTVVIMIKSAAKRERLALIKELSVVDMMRKNVMEDAFLRDLTVARLLRNGVMISHVAFLKNKTVAQKTSTGANGHTNVKKQDNVVSIKMTHGVMDKEDV